MNLCYHSIILLVNLLLNLSFVINFSYIFFICLCLLLHLRSFFN